MSLAPAAPQPPLRRWSTDAVGPQQRLDYWVGAICEAFLEMDCNARERGAFQGSLTQVDGGELAYNQVRAAPQDVYRTRAAISRGRSPAFYLITHLHAPWHVCQGGHTQQLRPGDAVLIDAARPYELHFPQPTDCLSIELPRAWLGRWLAQPESQGPRVAYRDQGWGRTLSALCLQLGEEPSLAAAYPQALLADQIGAMLAAAIEPALPKLPGAQGLVARAEDAMRQLLDRPGLTGAELAAMLGVSLRTLHRAFAAQGLALAARLRLLRLQRAAELLQQPRMAQVSVAEVGCRCGFSDASHFVRQFQQAHGLTPARWRRLHQR
ncbi:MAG TPA: helix-turn-helix domain-containing protein [Burkholderiaceae bacterium]|nr:helix-turn-helix domain-containing protein [Burkholderiaceae bacterium]